MRPVAPASTWSLHWDATRLCSPGGGGRHVERNSAFRGKGRWEASLRIATVGYTGRMDARSIARTIVIGIFVFSACFVAWGLWHAKQYQELL